MGRDFANVRPLFIKTEHVLMMYRYHVEIGSNEYFDPTLLFDEPPPAPEEETKMKTDSESQPNPVPPASMAQQDVVMATQSPTHQYPQHVPGGGISMRTPAPQSRYPQYVQPMNGSVPHGASTMTDHMGGNPMYAQQQHPVHMRMNSDVTGAHRMPPQGMYGRPPVPMGHQPPQHGVPIGLSYNTMGGGAPPGHPNSMDPSTMGMRGYSGTPQGTYPPSMHGGMGNTPQYPGGPHNPAPMSGTYGGLY